MVTPLQKAVEIIEDRHVGEKSGNQHRASNYRGSVLNATPAELDLLHKLAAPMSKVDVKAGRHIRGVRAWNNRKERAHANQVSRRKNA